MLSTPIKVSLQRYRERLFLFRITIKPGKQRGSTYVMELEEPSRLEGSPLATRARVTQEIILSRRIISYTECGLLWSRMRRNETEVGEKSVGGSILERSTACCAVVSCIRLSSLLTPRTS